jgi:hypothetical protein
MTNNNDLPLCPQCGSQDWRLEGELRILFYGEADDPAGPFKREGTVDSVHDLHFWCDGCGDDSPGAIAQVLGDIYRSHDPLRAFGAAQGSLLDMAGLKRDGEIALAQVPSVVRSGATTPLSDPKHGAPAVETENEKARQSRGASSFQVNRLSEVFGSVGDAGDAAVVISLDRRTGHYRLTFYRRRQVADLSTLPGVIERAIRDFEDEHRVQWEGIAITRSAARAPYTPEDGGSGGIGGGES